MGGSAGEAGGTPGCVRALRLFLLAGVAAFAGHTLIDSHRVAWWDDGLYNLLGLAGTLLLAMRARHGRADRGAWATLAVGFAL